MIFRWSEKTLTNIRAAQAIRAAAEQFTPDIHTAQAGGNSDRVVATPTHPECELRKWPSE